MTNRSMDNIAPSRTVSMQYKNHRGETSIRKVTPTGELLFTANSYHPNPQWLFEAYDVDRKVWRWFALDNCDFTAVIDGALVTAAST